MSAPEVARAKQVCAACPMRRDCLESGLRDGWGIWGGYTKPERMRALDKLGDAETVMQAFDQGDLDAIAVLA